MRTDEIIETVYREPHLKRDDYFDSNIFYYLAGRYPDLTICQCKEIVNGIRKKIMEDKKTDRE